MPYSFYESLKDFLVDKIRDFLIQNMKLEMGS